eukprot:9070828-Lingulodinium_polyedra.AAC.1
MASAEEARLAGLRPNHARPLRSGLFIPWRHAWPTTVATRGSLRQLAMDSSAQELADARCSCRMRPPRSSCSRHDEITKL